MPTIFEIQRQILVNEEAEQALLGALLINSNLYARVVDRLSVEDFSIPANGRIYAAIGRMVDQGKTADPVTLGPEFDNDPDFDMLGGGRRYLAELAGSIVSAGSLDDYADAIRDMADRRRLVDLAEHLTERVAAREPEKPGDYAPLAEPLPKLMAEAQRRIERMGVDDRRVMTKRQVAAQLAEGVTLPPRCYSTGIRCLDQAMLGGLYEGWSYGFEALDKRGKSTLAGTISHNLNAAGVLHAYFVLEAGAASIERRSAARAVRSNAMRFLTGGDEKFRLAVGRYAAEVPNNTLYVNVPGVTFDELKTILRSLVARHRIKGFIVDGWQLVEGRDKTVTEEKFLRRVAQWIADFGLQNGLWNIITAQLNDEGSAFGSRRGLQMACDQVYKLNRDPDSPNAWLEGLASRYTQLANVGSDDEPALFLDPIGPHYRDLFEPVQQGFV